METGIYVRVSTEEQAKEGYSVRGQEQKLKDYARIKDWTLYDVYIDEGISGKNITERPEMNRLVEDIKKGKVKNVLIFKIDRLTRSTSDLIYLIDLFSEHNCTFNSLMESIDTQTASGRMFLKIIGIFAEFERENISERIILGRERKVKEGYTLCSHTASYGYERPNGEKIQTIIEHEAIIVREIFDLYANKGISMTQIARRLNLREIPTKHNVKWSSNGVKNVLANNNYIGEVRHHFQDEERAYTVQGQHEAIITNEIFEKAQKRLSKIPRISPRKTPNEENYYSGFLICAKCGYKMNTHNSYSKLKDGSISFSTNYDCSNMAVGECDASSVSGKKLEKAFCEYIENIADFENKNALHVHELEQTKQEQQQQISEYEKKLSHFEAKEREALDFYVKNTLSITEYRQAKTMIDDDKQIIIEELERLRLETEEVTDNKIEIAQSVKENWSNLSKPEKRMFLMQFVEKIVLENQKLGIGERGRQKRKVKIYDIVFKQ